MEIPLNPIKSHQLVVIIQMWTLGHILTTEVPGPSLSRLANWLTTAGIDWLRGTCAGNHEFFRVYQVFTRYLPCIYLHWQGIPVECPLRSAISR